VDRGLRALSGVVGGDDTELAPLGAPDDRALAERARQRDADAFAALYRRHVDAIHAFAWRRTGSRHVADDITAATFEKAWVAIDRFEWRGGGFVAWLHRIAAHELADAHRRDARGTTPRAQAAVRGLHPVDEDDDDGLLADWPLVRVALDRLPARHQEVIALRYLAGLSAPDAADALGCTRSVLAVRLHRALRALAKEVDR
jgi:RNA polymerase sigma-70 factor (ECF subfamily)